MNIKKILAGVLICCIVGGVLPTVENVTNNNIITASAIDKEYTFGIYESVGYKKYSNYIEITGCNRDVTEVVIPAEIEGLPVKIIGESAFSYCSGLTSIEIPDSVTSIGDSAFQCCSSLISITIPDSVKNIGDYTFACCSGLTSIEISNSVTSIGIDAFYQCESLTSIKIPDSVTSIGFFAFGNCSSLTSITIPDSVTSIGDYAFSECSSLTSIIILNPECEIYEYAAGDTTTIYKTTTIYGYKNSTAQAYAEKYNREFVLLDGTPETTPTTTKPVTTTTKPTVTTTTAKPINTTTKPTATTTKPTTNTTTTTTKSPATTTTTVVSVTASLLGDANCDGEVNIADAAAIIQHLGNRDKYALSEQGLANADCCNVGDGVTGLDALALQKLEAKQISKLPDTAE